MVGKYVPFVHVSIRVVVTPQSYLPHSTIIYMILQRISVVV